MREGRGGGVRPRDHTAATRVEALRHLGRNGPWLVSLRRRVPSRGVWKHIGTYDRRVSAGEIRFDFGGGEYCVAVVGCGAGLHLREIDSVRLYIPGES